MQRQKIINRSLRNKIIFAPKWLQEMLGYFHMRYGYFLYMMNPVKYLAFNRLVQKSQWWPRSRIEEYQLKKLRYILQYAYNNVPYYREVFKRHGLKPQDFHTLKDLAKLPILKKEDVVNNFDKLVVQNISRRLIDSTSTSGSCGKPLNVYLDARYNFTDVAFMKRRCSIANIRNTDRHILLWSRIFIEENINEIYYYDPEMRRLSLSSLPHSVKRWREYLDFIREFKPAYISGNPSLLYHLACYAKEEGILNIGFKCFMSCFEHLFPFQRKLIEEIFSCVVYDFYSVEERVISAFECQEHRGLHIDMERGITEIVGEDDAVLPEGKAGRIIATGFYNFVMPLIRYETGDLGSVSKELCRCGRTLPLLKEFIGRTNESIKSGDRYFYSTTLAFLIGNFDSIKECQFVQDEENKLIVNIVRRKFFSGEDEVRIIKLIRDNIGNNLDIKINLVEIIPRTEMGKFPLVVSRLAGKGS